MMNGRLMRSVALLFLLFSCSFFASDRPQSAKNNYSFSHPSSWTMIASNEPDYIFYNPHGSSLMIQSFCDDFQSQSLSNLAQTTFSSLDKAKIYKQEEFMLQERSALRSEGKAVIDGVSVKLTLINTRRDNCYYDFLEVLPNEKSGPMVDHFLKGVTFR